MMQMRGIRAIAALGCAFSILGGCSAASIKPAEVLDERSGMTVGTLKRPMELIQSAENGPASGRRISFAYLGPAEWDNMGELRYGLWVHLAPGNDWQFESIRAPGMVALALDDGSITLSTIDPPELASAPYKPVAAWGQTAYFDLNVDTLKRMAASGKIELDFKAQSAQLVRFTADRDARDSLMRYLHARGY